MSEIDTLVFADPTGFVTGPTIDGFFDLDYMITGEVPESGFLGGSQLTIGASGIAPVVVRGVRDTATNRVVLGFLCRFSGSFAEDNAVALVFKTNHTSAHAQARKIVIQPVFDGIGAEPGVGTGANEIKTNVAVPPAHLDCYEPSGAGWTNAVGTWVADVQVKVRSWRPSVASGSPDEFAWSVEVSLPITAANGWPGLANDFGLAFSVIKIVPVGGGAVTQYKYPVTMNDATGLISAWVPSLYGHGFIPGIAGPALPALQGVGFVNDWQGIGRRAAGSGSLALGSEIQGASGSTDNEIVALLQNTGATDANDVTCEFRFANWGLPPADFTMWHKPTGLEPNPTPRRAGPSPQPAVNVLAGASNVALVSPWPRADVDPGYAAHTHQCMWAQLDANTPVNFYQSSTRRNMDFAHLSEIGEEAEVSGQGYPAPADGTDQHDFVLETFCRRIVVQELVGKPPESIDPALIEVLKPSLLGDKQDGAISHLHVNADHVGMASTGGGNQYQDTVVFVWQTFGYRVTQHTLTIGKTTYPILDNGTGSFGYVARHEGVKDALGWTFDGPDMVRYGNGLYGLKVPHKDVTRIKVRLVAEPDGPRGDSATKLPKGEFVPPKPDNSGDPGNGGNPGGDPGGDNGGTKPKPGGCAVYIAGLVSLPALVWGVSQLIA